VVGAVEEFAEALVFSGVLGRDVVEVAKDEEGVRLVEDVIELSVLERHCLSSPIRAAFIAIGCSL
jgi:hypothetical protein